jgi:hypothetical protein
MSLPTISRPSALTNVARQRFALRIVVCLAFFGYPSWASADSPVAKDSTTSKAAASAPVPSMKTPVPDPSVTKFETIEESAIEFVTQHHSELVSLLQLLKSMKEKEYDSTIREINKVQRRLESILKRDQELFGIELDVWKTQSKIDLLLARAISQNKLPDSESLKKLVKKQSEIQRKRLRHERNGLLERQKQIKEALEKLETNEDDRVEQQVAALAKRVKSKIEKPTESKPYPSKTVSDDKKKLGVSER